MALNARRKRVELAAIQSYKALICNDLQRLQFNGSPKSRKAKVTTTPKDLDFSGIQMLAGAARQSVEGYDSEACYQCLNRTTS